MHKIHLIRCEFEDEDHEEGYRLNRHSDDKTQSKLGMAFMVFATFLFMRSDQMYIKNPEMVDDILYLRIFYAIATIIFIFIYHKSTIYQMSDIILVIWVMLTVIVVLFINSSRAAQFPYHHITDVTIVMAFYIFFNNRFLYQVIPAILFSVANVILFSNLDVVAITEINTVIFAHGCVNFLGGYVSYNTKIYRRTNYELLYNQNKIDTGDND